MFLFTSLRRASIASLFFLSSLLSIIYLTITSRLQHLYPVLPPWIRLCRWVDSRSWDWFLRGYDRDKKWLQGPWLLALLLTGTALWTMCKPLFLLTLFMDLLWELRHYGRPLRPPGSLPMPSWQPWESVDLLFALQGPQALKSRSSWAPEGISMAIFPFTYKWTGGCQGLGGNPGSCAW